MKDQIWPKIGIFVHFGPGLAGSFGTLLVDWMVVVALGLYLARHLFTLSSPRASRLRLRAESARAFTGRRNSHSGRGEDFLSSQPIFFTETAVTPERKVEKWFPRWEINRHAEG